MKEVVEYEWQSDYSICLRKGYIHPCTTGSNSQIAEREGERGGGGREGKRE